MIDYIYGYGKKNHYKDMKKTKPAITVEIAQAKSICRTSVLGSYKGASMLLLQKTGSAEEPRAVYLVEKDPVTVIFKTTTCPQENQETVRQIKDEFSLSMKAYKAASDGVVVPISLEEFEDDVLGEYHFEAVYEYGGENLLEALKNPTGEEVMKVMGTVAKIMARLESQNLFHSSIRPTNIVISNGVIKLMNFGVDMSIDLKTRMLTTKDPKGEAFAYLPPEVLENQRGEPTAVDVYSWGITLYQLLTGRTQDQLNDDIKVRKSNYEAFLKNVQSLKINGDSDGSIKKRAIDILQKVLDPNPKLRPNFSMITIMLLTEGSQELEGIKEKLFQVTKERDEFKDKYQELFAEHNKFSDICNKLLVYLL